jgi:arylsulfatase A
MTRLLRQAADIVVLIIVIATAFMLLAGCTSVQTMRGPDGGTLVSASCDGSLFDYGDCLRRIAEAVGQERPNIVVIMADDMGYSDIAADTPNLQAMAARGMRFTDFHAAPYCTPTRADVQTGRYHQRMGLNNALAYDSTKGLPPAEVTIAEHLRDNGYDTALVGKWHLGRQIAYWPNNHGYNYFFGMTVGASDYFTHIDAGGNLNWWKNFQAVPGEEYSTHAFAREAIEFVNRASHPFLLFVTYQAVHWPYQAPDGTISYHKTLVAMDESIGQVTAALPPNTYVFFMSDNGGAKPSSNQPLRGNKGVVYEGGQRVTAIATGPGIPAGVISGELLAAIDLFPTASALAGVPLPTGVHLDGRDFSPILFGTGTLPPRPLFWTQGSTWAVRDGKWKLDFTGSKQLYDTELELYDTELELYDTETQLYDTEMDISEANNVAGSHPDLVSNLTNLFKAWKTDVTTNVQSVR